jgi:hypothetical protein
MKVGITATWRGTTAAQRERLRARLKELRPSAIVHGGCIGGDDEADIIAAELGIHRFVFPSTITKKRVPDEVLKSRTGSLVTIMPPDEPLLRNPRIVRNVARLIALPRQAQEIIRSGTWTTVRLGRKILGRENVEIIGPQ